MALADWISVIVVGKLTMDGRLATLMMLVSEALPSAVRLFTLMGTLLMLGMVTCRVDGKVELSTEKLLMGWPAVPAVLVMMSNPPDMVRALVPPVSWMSWASTV